MKNMEQCSQEELDTFFKEIKLQAESGIASAEDLLVAVGIFQFNACDTFLSPMECNSGKPDFTCTLCRRLAAKVLEASLPEKKGEDQ